MIRGSLAVRAVGLLLLMSINCWTAVLTGDIEGIVIGTSGNAVSGAKATITSEGTSSRLLVTDERGYFIAALLPIGTYEVRVEAPGLPTYVDRVVVKSAERISLNIDLRFRADPVRIDVGEPLIQLVNKTDAQLTMSVEEEQVQGLPLATRDPIVLATLSPGVVPITLAGQFLGFNSNGGRGRGTNITVDNVTATDVNNAGTAGLGTLSLESIAEFKLITNNFNAEWGRNASAQVQIVTKSGTNQFHGTAYEYFQNNALNARDYFDRTGKASVLKRNQFGFTLGGPILNNRLFYFGHYEGVQRRGAGATRSATVPTDAQLQSVTNSTSLAILDAVNLPAAETLTTGGLSGRVSQTAPNVNESNAFSSRLDYKLGTLNLLSGRYSFQKSKMESPLTTFFTASNLAGFGYSAENKPQNVSLGWIRSIGERMTNEARFTFGRSSPEFFPQFKESTPRISITGFDPFGEFPTIPQGRTQNTFQYSDVLTHATGRHFWKYGVDIHRIQANSIADVNARGTLTFADWNSFANGTPQSFSQQFGSSVRGFRVTNIFSFVQDDFKILPDLTLNLGFRLEIAGGVSEVNGILSNLDLKTPAPIGGAGPGPLGSFVQGEPAFRRNANPEPRVGFAWNPNRGKLIVRGGYGISHDFIFLNPITNLRSAPPFIQSVSLTGTSSFAGGNSYASIYDGTAAIQIQGRAAVGTFSSTQTNFGNFSPIDMDLDNPQVQHWSLTVEREISPKLAARVSYVGTAGRHLLRSRQANMIQPGLVRPATDEADEVARLAEFSSIFAGSNAGPTGSSNRIDPRFNSVTLVESSSNSNYHALEAQVSKRYSKRHQIQGSYTWSKSIDDVSDVLEGLPSDTASVQNPFDFRNNRAASQFDVTHRLVIHHLWDLPLYPNASGLMGKLLHGWAFNGIFEAQSGQPVNIFARSRFGILDISLSGNTLAPNPVRANVSGDLSTVAFAPAGSPEAALIPTPAARGVNSSPTSSNVNTSNYPLTQPLLGNFGSLGRNVLRMNGLTNFNWVLSKDTAVSESLRMQFRAEFYNVFNNTSFSQLVNDLSSSAFGTYSGTETTARQIQFGLKLIW